MHNSYYTNLNFIDKFLFNNYDIDYNSLNSYILDIDYDKI